MQLIFHRFLGFIIAIVYFPIMVSLGFKRRVTNFQKHWEEAGRSLVRCGWHEDIIAFVYRHAFRRMCVMASQSKDGEMITAGLKVLGFKIVRGSSTRGGSDAFREMLNASRNGYNISLMMDGPKGPRRVIKPGILLLASAMGTPVIPAVAVVKWYIRVNSWDRMIIPIPFSPSLELNGRPIMIPRNLAESELKDKIQEVENEFRNLYKIAEGVFSKRRVWRSVRS